MKSHFNSASLASRGAREQVRIATALMVFIPIMATSFLAMSMCFPRNTIANICQITVGLLTLIIVMGGYMILRKYPENIIHLQRYIHEMAAGDYSNRVDLYKPEEADEVKSIEKDLNSILSQLHEKLIVLENQLTREKMLKNTVKSQHDRLLQAEQHRVMIQSLGAACHHLGQPATVLRMHLFLLKEQVDSEETKNELEECVLAVESMVDILEKLRKVSQYRTVPYVNSEDADEAEILNIEH